MSLRSLTANKNFRQKNQGLLRYGSTLIFAFGLAVLFLPGAYKAQATTILSQTQVDGSHDLGLYSNTIQYIYDHYADASAPDLYGANANDLLTSITVQLTSISACSMHTYLYAQGVDGLDEYSTNYMAVSFAANETKDLIFTFPGSHAVKTLTHFSYGGNDGGCSYNLKAPYGTVNIGGYAANHMTSYATDSVVFAINGSFTPPDPRSDPVVDIIHPIPSGSYALNDILDTNQASGMFLVGSNLPTDVHDSWIVFESKLKDNEGNTLKEYTCDNNTCSFNTLDSGTTNWYASNYFLYFFSLGTYNFDSRVCVNWTDGEAVPSPTGPYNHTVCSEWESIAFTVTDAVDPDTTWWGETKNKIANLVLWIFIPNDNNYFGQVLSNSWQAIIEQWKTKVGIRQFYQLVTIWQSKVDMQTSSLPAFELNLPLEGQDHIMTIDPSGDTQTMAIATRMRPYLNIALWLGWAFFMWGIGTKIVMDPKQAPVKTHYENQ